MLQLYLFVFVEKGLCPQEFSTSLKIDKPGIKIAYLLGP